MNFSSARCRARTRTFAHPSGKIAAARGCTAGTVKGSRRRTSPLDRTKRLTLTGHHTAPASSLSPSAVERHGASPELTWCCRKRYVAYRVDHGRSIYRARAHAGGLRAHHDGARARRLFPALAAAFSVTMAAAGRVLSGFGIVGFTHFGVRYLPLGSICLLGAAALALERRRRHGLDFASTGPTRSAP